MKMRLGGVGWLVKTDELVPVFLGGQEPSLATGWGVPPQNTLLLVLLH